MKYCKTAGDQPTESYAFANYRRRIKLLCLAAVFMAWAISACDFREVDASAETTSKKESNMESIQAITTIENKIPPIDLAVPTQIETATFAMG